MTTLRLVFLLITANVVTPEQVNVTESVITESKNAFKFEDQTAQYGLIRFEDQGRPDNLDDGFQNFDGSHNAIDNQRVKFEDQDIRAHPYGNENTVNEAQSIKFEDNRVKIPKQQKKKRRRKPKRLQNPQGYGYVQPYPGSVYPGAPAYPGPPGYPGHYGPGPIYPGQRPYQPSYPGTLYKPRPSATSAALSAVTEALTSIALYDDAQCVPRLLCEAAGGAVPGTGLPQSVVSLQPLLTLLAAYNGISSSPLFVFGRAVFLGMTSKANPGTCRYAYSQCPNDPEQLVHYLNNHNGGFFRFFSAPEQNQQQGLEQFYNQLSGQIQGQNYGLYEQQQSLQNQNLQGYGLQQTYPNPHLYGQIGQSQQLNQYQNQFQQFQQGNYQNQMQHGYGLAQHQYYNHNYNQRPNLYNGYGQGYPYQNNLNHNKIQKRIQNVRNTAFVNNSRNPKWSFPEDSSNKHYNNVRLGKVLRFPQSNVNSVSAAEGFIFPGAQSNREYPIDSIESEGDSELSIDGSSSSSGFGFNNQNYKVGHGFDDNSNNKDGVRIVYIVRGNGDPNNPEIVRLLPGQTL